MLLSIAWLTNWCGTNWFLVFRTARLQKASCGRDILLWKRHCMKLPALNRPTETCQKSAKAKILPFLRSLRNLHCWTSAVIIVGFWAMSWETARSPKICSCCKKWPWGSKVLLEAKMSRKYSRFRAARESPLRWGEGERRRDALSGGQKVFRFSSDRPPDRQIGAWFSYGVWK